MKNSKKANKTDAPDRKSRKIGMVKVDDTMLEIMIDIDL